MSYLVLARKYRPQVFEDVVGQGHVTRTLANAISAGRVAHAYLFCGPRGVGKTTAARILAKALNCETGPTSVPCNQCRNCGEITGGRSMDVLEIDGASNRGINEVRELRENTRYAPSGGGYKVYIIDEVHMLTHEAFNALLKTLEEPPPHVVFVLATTEPFKVPGTILSRCQRFDFARIPSREIAAHVEKLMAAEEIAVSTEAISLVARRAAGGLRDALSLMDQIISAVDGDIDRPTVERILGLVGGDFYYALTDLLAEEHAAGCLRLLDEIYSGGADLRELAEGLTGHLRDLLLLKLDEGLADVVEAPESEVPRLRRQADRFSADVLTELVDRAAETAVALRRSEHPRLTMELALAEMAQAAGRVPLADLAERLLTLERAMGAGGVADPDSEEPATATGPKGKPARGSGRPAKTAGTERGAAPAGGGDAANLWADCLAGLQTRSMVLWGTFHQAEAVGFAEDGALVLKPPAGGGFLRKMAASEENRATLAEVLTELGARNPSVRLEGETGPEKLAPARRAAKATAPAPAPVDPPAAPVPEPRAAKPAKAAEQVQPTESPGPDAPAPAKKTVKKQPEAEEDTRSMGQLFKDEPLLQKALDMFDGEVLP